MTDIYSRNIRPKFIPEFIWLWIIIIIPCSLPRNISLCHSCWTPRDIIKLFTLYIPDPRDPSAENKISSRIYHEYSCARSLASRVDSCVSPSLRARKSFALSLSLSPSRTIGDDVLTIPQRRGTLGGTVTRARDRLPFLPPPPPPRIILARVVSLVYLVSPSC